MSEAILEAALACLARGFVLTPVKGKKAFQEEWQKRTSCTEAEVRLWLAKGYDIGVVCGEASGVDALDVDDPTAALGDLPETTRQATPSGGYHLLFRHHPGLGCGRGRLPKGVDVRGQGGQVRLYGLSDAPPAPWPQHLLDLILRTKPPPRPPPRAHGAKTARAAAALSSAAARIEHAGQGDSHHTTFAESAAIGELVGAGELDEADVLAVLEAAAERRAPHQREEALRAVRDGVARGKTSPRTDPPRAVAQRAPPPPRKPAVPDHEPPQWMDEDHDAPPRSRKVLVPGDWGMADGGERQRVGPAAFARAALSAIPSGAVYRRGKLPGQISGEAGSREFEVLSHPRARVLLSRHAEFISTKWNQHAETFEEVFEPITNDHASLVLARAVDDDQVPELRWLSGYPFCWGEDFSVARPGLNDGGAFFDPPPGLSIPVVRDRQRIRDILDDLVIDFPFDGDASRQNFYGLMLTPIMRPAIRGTAPMHVVTSHVERTGKSTLVRDVFGGSVIGSQTPPLFLQGTLEEQDKRVTAKLLAGGTVAMLDNIRDEIDSPVLAALLTSPVYEGRRLGQSETVALPNYLTVVATGNNLRASSEIAKRSIPIVLSSPLPRPEERDDFRHRHIYEYARERRAEILGALLGAIELWRVAGAPRGAVAMGGFEPWRDAVGGVMRVMGWDAWLSNRGGWVETADDWGGDLVRLVACWWDEFGESAVDSDTLLTMADGLDVFGPILAKAPNTRARATVFGTKVMRRAAGQVVQPKQDVLARVERIGGGSHSRYRLAGIQRPVVAGRLTRSLDVNP